jgi:hypothetical protein
MQRQIFTIQPPKTKPPRHETFESEIQISTAFESDLALLALFTSHSSSGAFFENPDVVLV